MPLEYHMRVLRLREKRKRERLKNLIISTPKIQLDRKNQNRILDINNKSLYSINSILIYINLTVKYITK